MHHSPAVVERTRSLWHFAAYVMAVTVAVILGVLKATVVNRHGFVRGW